TSSDLAMQGSTVMRQRCAATLATEEPDAVIAHVRVCGGAGWVTTGSTRKLTAYSLRFAALRSGCRQQLKAGVDMTSDVKGWAQLFYVRLIVFSFCLSEEPEPVKHDG